MNSADSSVAPDVIIRGYLRRRNLTRDTEEYVAAREQARRWLAQFENSEQAYMLEVMQAMRIETSAKFDRAISKLARMIVKILANRHAQAAYFGIGDSPASSGIHFLNPLLRELGLDNRYGKNLGELQYFLERGTPVVFIDDIIGSGNQAVRFSKEVLRTAPQTAIYGCLYGFEHGIQNVQKNGLFGQVLTANLLKEKDRTFTANSQLIRDAASRRAIKRIAMKYGKRIYPSGPLGYDNSELLISFPHNTPNNTLPIIWGGVESESEATDWEPLIARKKAPKAFLSAAVELNGANQRPPEARLPDKPDSYENLHPSESARVVNVFVEPRYDIEINTDSGIQRGIPQGFVSDVTSFLEKNDKIVVISSPYGCGKTFLSKYLDLTGRIGDSKKVAYVSAIALKRIISMRVSCEGLFSGVVTCIVDSVDELVIDDLDAERNLTALCRCLTVARRAGTKIILNLRVSEANYLENRTINSIFENLYADGSDLRLPVIRVRGFEKEQIVHWLANYQSNDGDSQLTYSGIETTHRRLGYAAGNPLFLYQLALYYQRLGKYESIYTVYQIYDVFVDSTTTGRFEPIDSPKRPRVWRLSSLYSVFLEHVACAINNSRKFRANLQVENDPDFDWRLDANDMTHSISDKELSSSMEGRPSRFLIREDDVGKSIRDGRLELLNNYFFTRNSELIGFKDNNILFFLVAKRLFRAISGLVNDAYEALTDHLNIIAETKSHPQAIEILLKRIQTEGDTFRSALSRRIDELIKDNRIIQLTSESLERLTGSAINRDIILGIVLLHVKRGSYDQLGYFLTRLSWLTSAVKFHDSIYRTLVARFFRNIQLREIEFRRLNCDGYNFRGTSFAAVRFIQCKLFSSNFDDTKHVGTNFSLCDFGGHREVSTFSRISGDISFDHCNIGRLVIHQQDQTASLSMYRCDIAELHIESTNSIAIARINLSIKGSKVGKIFFVNVYLGSCDFRDSHIEQISDKNSKGSIDYSFSRPRSAIQWGKQTGRIRLNEPSD